MESSNHDEIYKRYREMRNDYDSHYRSRSDAALNGGFEYGLTVIRQLFIIYGGAILALPALVSLADFPTSSAIWASILFVLALSMNTICAYSSHINWMSHSHLDEEYRMIHVNYIHNLFFDEEKKDFKKMIEDSKELRDSNRAISVTFWTSHVTGIAGGVFFISGCSVLFVRALFS